MADIDRLIENACMPKIAEQEVLPLLDILHAEIFASGSNSLDIDLAYKIILKLYTQFAKPRETLGAYKILASFAMKISRIVKADNISFPKSKRDAKLTKIIFIIDTDAWLGHVQIMCSFFQKAAKQTRECLEVIALNGKKNSILSHKLKAYGIKYYTLEDQFMSLKLAKLKEYIEHLNSEEVSVKLIWTGWPPIMFLGGCIRLGYKQAIWAMKYPYPLSYQTDEVYFAYGFHEKIEGRFILQDSFQPIISHPFHLTADALSTHEKSESMDQLTASAIKKLKLIKQNGQEVMLSAARPEKMCNNIFLTRLDNILKMNPNFIFAWCGRHGDKSTKKFEGELTKKNIHKRALFIGWIHTWDVIPMADFFLDTYPFGSGITLAQAMRNSKRIILHEAHTVAKELLGHIDSFVISEPNYSDILKETSGYPEGLKFVISDSIDTCIFKHKIVLTNQNSDLFSPSASVHNKLTNLILS